MAKSKKHIVTNMDRLKMMKKVMRETTHKVKPMVTTDKKKKRNKLESRKFKQTKNKSHE